MNSAAHRAGRSGQAVTLLADLIVPVATYYLLRVAGINTLLALVLSSMPTAVLLVYQSVRHRRIGILGTFVLLLIAASVAVSLVTGSPRFLMAKAGWFTAAIGVVFLSTLLLARPLAFTLARGMLRQSPMAATFNTDAWDEMWEREPAFRRVWRACTTLWGVGLLSDAAARVIMAYTLPVDAVPALGTALWGLTFVVLQLIQHRYFVRARLGATLRQQPLPGITNREPA
ncbi:MAG: VC0807 family protein [Umezawaea sp.]